MRKRIVSNRTKDIRHRLIRQEKLMEKLIEILIKKEIITEEDLK